MPHDQLHLVSSTALGQITCSDHAPVHLTYTLTGRPSPRSLFWHLNESLLQIPEVLEDVSKEIDLYFKENDVQDCDPGILWEAHKCVLRWILIKHGANIKKERNAQLTRLLSELVVTESQHKHLPTRNLETNLGTLRTQITDILLYKAKATLQFCRRMSYESGDKCGKLLAKSVKEIKASSYIPQITLPDGKRATLRTQISKGFEVFYSDLYNLPSSPSSQTNIDQYISDSQIPSLSEKTQSLLDEPITLEELQIAVNSMKIGKAPGPDSYTVQYYKNFLPILGPRLVAFFNTLRAGSNFPSETLKAHISLI